MVSDKNVDFNKKEGTLFNRLIEFAKQIKHFNNLSKDNLIYLRCIGEHPLDDYVRIVQDENDYSKIMVNGPNHYERTITRRGLYEQAIHIITCYFLVNGFAERIMIATVSNEVHPQYKKIVETLKSINVKYRLYGGGISVDTPLKRLVSTEFTRMKDENRVFWVSATSDAMRGSTPTIGIYMHPSEKVQENMNVIKDFSRIHLIFL